MKKTLSSNIGGAIFHIEEDAYAKLDQYLNSVRAKFQNDPSKDEIVRDIEARMSEQFLGQKKSGADKIIALIDVENLIKIMGSPEDLDTEEGRAPEQKNESKRFYRNPDDQIIAGIASGIAVYFDIDPIIVRVLFAASLLAGGFGIFLYIILWVVVPEAQTPAEKMQMRGSPINLSAVEQKVKEKINNLNTEKSRSAIRKIFEGVGKLIRGIIRYTGKFAAIIATIVLSAILVFGTIMFIIMLFNGSSPYVDFPLAAVAQGNTYYLLLTALYLSAIIPALFVLIMAISALRAKNLVTYTIGFAMLGIWLAASSTAASMSVGLIPEYQAYVENAPQFQVIEKTYDLKGFSQIETHDAIKVKIVQGTNYSVKASGRQKDIDELELKVDQVELYLNQNESERICFFCHGSRPVTVEITMPQLGGVDARGASQVEAGKFNPENFKAQVSGASRLSIELTDTKKVEFTMSGASRTELSGKASDLTAVVSGASRLESQNLVVETAQLESSGASNVSVNASRNLRVDASGASKVYYLGNPSLDYDLSGAARIESLDTGSIKLRLSPPNHPIIIDPYLN